MIKTEDGEREIPRINRRWKKNVDCSRKRSVSGLDFLRLVSITSTFNMFCKAKTFAVRD